MAVDKKAVLEIVGLAYEVQRRGAGADGFPFVNAQTSNYGHGLSVYIMDNGFDQKQKYDGNYYFDFVEENSPREIQNCKAHLQELLERVKGLER